MPAAAGRHHRPLRRATADFFRRAYTENITGMAGMVAYNMLLSVFPLALVALFIAGRVLESAELERSILSDLQQLFPTTTDDTLSRALGRVRDSSAGFGFFAIAASIYFGSSFWGALDTAFCRLYHVKCRPWVRQKAFALLMLVFVLVFMAATVAVPTIQSLLVSQAENLPLGLSEVPGLIFGVTLGLGLLLTFLILCLIYLTVPNQRVPWRAVWPGALGATLAIGIVDYAFPIYISNFSTASRFGTIFVFVLIVLIWFYVLSIIILGGAVVNSMRFELHDTGELRAA